MNSKTEKLLIPQESILKKIYFIRGYKVMLDSDIAELYQVETKRLKEQVKRNISRFPSTYMFELTQKELDSLRSQIATSNSGRGGTRYLPMVFTEHGVLQLSNVLKSKRAEQVSFIIIDVFVRLRETLLNTTDLRLAIEQIRSKTEDNTKNIDIVFQCLDELLQKQSETPERKQIGYKTIP
ncbi:MAG: DNA-binding protein [Bacteroidetes bacterium]|jgi:hypothetical protein|nr:DNA-binding protein [Bacteroidota bacterium]